MVPSHHKLVSSNLHCCKLYITSWMGKDVDEPIHTLEFHSRLMQAVRDCKVPLIKHSDISVVAI